MLVLGVVAFLALGPQTAVRRENIDYAPVVPATLLVDRASLMKLPTSGPAWDNIVEWSERTEVLDLAYNDSNHDMVALACALRGVRTGEMAYQVKARNYIAVAAFSRAVFDDPLVRSLSIGRNVLSYVLAADLLELDRRQPEVDALVREWLVLVEETAWPGDGRTLREAHEVRPNNWGLVCGATRIAIDMYLRDAQALNDIALARRVFHAWLGAPGQWDLFVWGGGQPRDNSWQPYEDPELYRGIGAVGATLGGGVHDADGLMPDDQRRVGDLECLNTLISYPVGWGVTTSYTWEALQGAVMQAHLLARCGYPAFEWEDRALERAVRWLYDVNDFPPEATEFACGGEVDTPTSTWVPHVTDHYYGTHRATTLGGRPGRNCGFADWWVHALSPSDVPPHLPRSLK
jgi:hypothetical protein